ncbi:hypothetical protein F2Q68_00021173 [Brassica cretica]|nr:hypothetical protein F2Q68_00021173 [Brassica cretica]
MRSRVPLRPEPHSEPGGGPVPLFQTGVWRYRTVDFLPKVPVRDEKGDRHDEASNFSPSRGVLSLARGDFPSGRVRSKRQRSGAGPSELMDSSGSSLDLTAKIENLSRTSTGVAPPSPEIYRFLPVGPLSLIGVEEVASWRVKYHLPDDVIIRILCLVDRVPDFEVDEVPVYEGEDTDSLAESRRSRRSHYRGRRGSVLICYHPLNGGEQIYHLHPRGGELPVQEIVKNERKRLPVFDGRWTEKFAFMYLPGFSTIWCTTDIPSVDPSSGEKTIKQVLELPIERRQLAEMYLYYALGNMSGSKGEEALAEYERALEVMSAKKAAPKKASLSENND